MLYKNRKNHATYFIAMLTSVVLIILIIFTFITKTLYIADSKKMLTDIYINSIYDFQDKTLSKFSFSVNQLNKYSSQITKSNEFKDIYTQNTSDEQMIIYNNYLRQYCSLTNSKYIGIYDKRTERFLYPASSPVDIKILENSIEQYNNGFSFFSQESDGAEITYTTNTYTGFIIVFLLSQNFFDEIYQSTENYSTYLFWNGSLVYSVGPDTEKYDIAYVNKQFMSAKSMSGSQWIDDVLYVCRKSSNYSQISAVPNTLLTSYFSHTLNKINRILYLLLTVSATISLSFFWLYGKIFKKNFAYNSSNASKMLSNTLKHAFTEEYIPPEDMNLLKNELSGYTHFRCIVMQCDNLKVIQKENTPSDISYMFSRVKSVCCEKLSPSKAFISQIHSDCICIIAASHTPTANYMDSVAQIQEFTEKTFALTFTYTISEEITDAENIANICRNVYNQKEERFFMGFKAIIQCETLNTSDKIEYPHELERSIISYLDANNIEDCYNDIERFICAIHECRAVTAREYILQLTFALIKDSEYIKKKNSIGYEFIHKMAECETIDKCINMIATIIPIFDIPVTNNETSFLQLILNLIENEYSNPELDLNFIAEQLKLTPHYLGHKFQKLFGKTFSAHLAEYRIKKAKEMLIETNWKVAYIALKCGFNSTSYFIRIFKKYALISPSEYRKQYKL